MIKALKSGLKAGFTLIEILVTIIIIAVLAAVVIPAVTNQIGAADPTRVAEDMANLRTGIETFSLNVRPRSPGDLDDLANPITTADLDIKAQNYSSSSVTAWNGPYISATVSNLVQATNEVATNSGFNSTILADLDSCSSAVGLGCVVPAGTDPKFVTVKIDGLDAVQFRAVNDVLDGANDSTTASTTGKLRYNGTTTFFLATPFK